MYPVLLVISDVCVFTNENWRAIKLIKSKYGKVFVVGFD